MQQITPFIWFNGQAEEAINFYVSVFPNSKIVGIERYSGDQSIPGEAELKGKVLNGIFQLNGQPFMCLDGGPVFASGGNISFFTEFAFQNELDDVWNKLLVGGKPQQCGWITDKFGITWQITPTALGRLMSHPDATPEQKTAVMQAMMPMIKLEIEPLQAAFERAKV